MGKNQFKNDNKKNPKVKIERTFKQDTDLERIIKMVIDEQNIDTANAKICGLRVDPNISDFIAGRCIRSGKELKHFSGYQYIIQVSGQLWDALNDETRYLLVYHELLHIDIKYKKTGDVTYAIRDHDIKDFRSIIKKYGVDWINEMNLINSSLVGQGKSGDIKL